MPLELLDARTADPDPPFPDQGEAAWSGMFVRPRMESIGVVRCLSVVPSPFEQMKLRFVVPRAVGLPGGDSHAQEPLCQEMDGIEKVPALAGVLHSVFLWHQPYYRDRLK